MMKTILADIDVPPDAIAHAIPSILWILFFVLLCLGIWNQGKKAFGRRPPIDDELEAREKKLRGEIAHAKNSVRKELGDRITDVEEIVGNIQVDRERKWAEWKNEIHAVDSKVERLLGRIESVFKKVERL